MSTTDPGGEARGSRARAILHAVLLAWIALTSVFFFIRFSFAFYFANREAIHAALGFGLLLTLLPAAAPVF